MADDRSNPGNSGPNESVGFPMLATTERVATPGLEEAVDMKARLELTERAEPTL